MQTASRLANTAKNRSAVSSIEARRILAVLEDCRNRINYALLLPTLEEYFEGRDVPEDVVSAHAAFLIHQHSISSMMTPDGQAKPGRAQDLEEETQLFRDSARDLIRVMKEHEDFFEPLLQQSSNSGGAAHKLQQMLLDMDRCMMLTFITPVENDKKQKKSMKEIEQRKKSSIELIEQLTTRLNALNAEKDKKIKSKENALDELKQQLQQAKANEAALSHEEVIHDDVEAQEETLNQQLQESKTRLKEMQQQNSEKEGANRRRLRKEEEAVQEIINNYDQVSKTLTAEIKVLTVEAETAEKELHDLHAVYDEIERKRTPLRNEEEMLIEKTMEANKKSQLMIAASMKLQYEIRKYLQTAPKATRKKSRKGKRK